MTTIDAPSSSASRAVLPMLERYAGRLAVVLTAVSATIWTWFTFWKYSRFLYDAFDLAIYSQVLWNTSYGRLFQFSIHPQSYLGDHFEPLILTLAPLYALWRDPRLLLLLQIIITHVAVWPLYLLARNLFRQRTIIRSPRALALSIVVAYLTNPFLHNALAFEFHILPFFLPFIFASLYFAERGRLTPSFICLSAALLVREDIAPIVALTGVVAVAMFPATRPRWKTWTMTPFIAASIWFLTAIMIVSSFAPNGEYKFAVYYGVSQGNVWQTLGSVVAAPWIMLERLTRGQLLVTATGLLLPTAFLALFSWPALLLALGPFLEFATAGVDTRGILILHYAVLFLPALMLAVISALARLADQKIPIPFTAHWPTSWQLHLAVAGLCATSVYAAFVFGPAKLFIDPAGKQTLRDDAAPAIYHKAIALAQNGDGVVASKKFLTALSQRSRLYALRYVLRGRQQLSELPYEITAPVTAAVISHDDLLSNVPMRGRDQIFVDTYAERAAHLRKLLATHNLSPVWSRDDVVVYLPSPPHALTLISTESAAKLLPAAVSVAPGLKAIATLAPDEDGRRLDIRWEVVRAPTETYFVEVHYRDRSGQTLRTIAFDPGWGIQPTDTWQTGTVVTSTFWLSWPAKTVDLTLQLRPTSEITYFYGPLRNAAPIITPITTNNSVSLLIVRDSSTH